MTNRSQSIYFHFPAGRVYLPNRNRLRKYLLSIFRKHGKKVGQVNYIFCSDADLLKINIKYLKHHTLTDIITFPYHNPGNPILSDIFISIDRIKENARKFETSVVSELYRVMFHGALHLCGYNDKTQNQKKIMRQKENFYLNHYWQLFHGTLFRPETVSRGTYLCVIFNLWPGKDGHLLLKKLQRF